MKAPGVLAVIVVLALVVVSLVAGMEFADLGGRSYSTTITVSTTRTVTPSSSSGPNGPTVITEEVIIESEVVNGICFLGYGNTTSTAYLTTVTPSASSGSVSNQPTTVTTTTETLSAIGTITVYRNVTMIGTGTTCTEINPHYNVTSSCPPCV